MGSCFSLNISGSRRRRRQGEQYGAAVRGHRSVGEIQTQPLKPVKPKWKSDIPITDGQLRSKRDEFWETAPAFEGRREIWDALKAASVALETGDHALAQAIIDGANILLPYGTLTDCYDELGNRYQLPVYVLSSPVNLVEDVSGESENTTELADLQPGGKDFVLGVRLSTGKELKLKVNTGESVHHLKRRIFELEGIDPVKQRFLFCGHLLVDRDRLNSIKIPKGFMLQVMVVEYISVQSSNETENVVENSATAVVAPEGLLNDAKTDSPAFCDNTTEVNGIQSELTQQNARPLEDNVIPACQNDNSSVQEGTVAVTEAIEMSPL